jgi:aminoglycoside 6'-N-acetyltransferase I
MNILHLVPDDQARLDQVAQLLVDAFREHCPEAWPDLGSGQLEVRESLTPGRLSRVAIDDQGQVLGWIGGIPQYNGHVWEVHPLAVRPDRQRQGVGRALVVDLEARVRERGGKTLWVGTDDEDDQTSIAGVDLYPDLLGRLAHIRNLRGHPYEFYQKVGFVLAGVVPDANGPGKPDILMAKRVDR